MAIVPGRFFQAESLSEESRGGKPIALRQEI